ncbi:ATP-dependent DNA helicase [Agromyces rhizosphaerae]|uniref:DNA 3'-5' helicase n=1 Tax=Agromyces rhizosphaerae TaxID=88374 RepID=A0A9W6CTZ2_9MICO|nr:UvrD-helicase domain-containing protein [Agromyces rhizosphaerae]GLI28438.1 ATP-dependent DNA helicase [Agromyces rhizosphaerae]
MIGAREIAARLGLPAPTDEQCAVIEAPHAAQSLVVAGAGSGKTETMANRVVWLLANGHVAVPEVLGLTFTRKAAGELAERISRRVGQLVHEGIARVELDLLDAAEVSTYNAFASAIYREHAMRIGREPDAALLGEASAWQLARRVVLDSDDDRLVELDASADRITGAVLGLSRGIAENVADPRDVRVMARQFLAMHDLPTGSARKKAPYASFAQAMQQVGALPVLVDLAERFALEKRRRGLLEFSDQVAFALEICASEPGVVEAYRSRYGAVLLDEYQDTSVVQTRLLSTLFGGQSVMAVGDPDQSIYGWRGASATNLARFGGDFGDADAPVYDLSTSWRNPRRVLDAANTLLRPFLDAPVVPKRALEAAPGAGDGAVDLRWGETIEDEAAAVADWFAGRLRTGGRPPSAAMLCRTLKQVDVFAEAFEARGVPFHVLGLAGLLDQPVIADLVSALRVLHDPSAGAELLRLLGGARWRVGAADLAGLAETARWLAARDHALQPLDDAVRARLRSSVAAEEHASLVDALDFVVEAPEGHAATARISAEGLARMRAAGAQLMSLRRRAGLELADLVTLVQHELLLDIEVGANAAQPLGAPSLEAFDELLAGFLDVSEAPTLGAFLGWLAEAEQRDRLAPRQDEPEPGTVQVLTVHGAKGLEWDLVAIPRAVEDELPAAPLSTKGWLAFGALPYEFKGDRDELPELAWRGVHDQKQFDEAARDYQAEIRRLHEEEQRRLAYVAVTRARHSLLFSGSWWSVQKGARGPSPYLHELVAGGVLDEALLPGPSAHESNPREGGGQRATWPLDPLGTRRARVTAAADAVRAAREAGADSAIGDALARDLELLIAERDARRSPEEAGEARPTRVPASRFKDWVDDPAGVAAELRRPLPQRPYRATRIGTLFHSWVEARSTGVGDAVDAEAFELDAGDAVPVEHERLARLQATFAASPWGHRRPDEVEVEIHLPLGGTVFVCKLDAVYQVDPDSEAGRRGIRYEVVDWKTGAAPRDARDLELKQTQLALYRLAFATWREVPVEEVDALFYFVEDDEVVRPERLYDEEELLASWSSSVA